MKSKSISAEIGLEASKVRVENSSTNIKSPLISSKNIILSSVKTNDKAIVLKPIQTEKDKLK